MSNKPNRAVQNAIKSMRRKAIIGLLEMTVPPKKIIQAFAITQEDCIEYLCPHLYPQHTLEYTALPEGIQAEAKRIFEEEVKEACQILDRNGTPDADIRIGLNISDEKFNEYTGKNYFQPWDAPFMTAEEQLVELEGAVSLVFTDDKENS